MCVGCYTTQILTVMEVRKSTVKKPWTDIWHQKCLSSLSNQLKMLVFSKIQQNNFEIFQTRNGPCLMTGSECRSIYLDFLLCLDTCFLWSFKMSYPIFFVVFKHHPETCMNSAACIACCRRQRDKRRRRLVLHCIFLMLWRGEHLYCSRLCRWPYSCLNPEAFSNNN